MLCTAISNGGYCTKVKFCIFPPLIIVISRLLHTEETSRYGYLTSTIIHVDCTCIIYTLFLKLQLASTEYEHLRFDRLQHALLQVSTF